MWGWRAGLAPCLGVRLQSDDVKCGEEGNSPKSASELTCKSILATPKAAQTLSPDLGRREHGGSKWPGGVRSSCRAV